MSTGGCVVYFKLRLVYRVATFYNTVVDPFRTHSYLRNEFVPAPCDAGYDYVSRNGKTLVEVQLALRGVRDVHASALRLALAVRDCPTAEEACLVANIEKVSAVRLAKEWKKIRSILQPDVGRRLKVVAITNGVLVVEPEDPVLRGIGVAVQSSLYPAPARGSGQDAISSFAPRLVAVAPTRTYIEIAKVLLCRWLQEEGPIAVGELAKQVGCSSPPATQAVARLERLGVLRRHRKRAVELTGFSQQLWAELIALAGTNRPTLYFIDPTKQEQAQTGLLDRLLRLKPKGVAFGGVLAARRWDPAFDLNGVPRIDLEVHAANGRLELDFISQLDPALRPVNLSQNSAPILAVHPLSRAAPLFTQAPEHQMPYADPLETVFDLHELRLDSQANDLIRRMRPGARFL